MLKRCPVCGALSYSDTEICFECMHEFGEPYAEGNYEDIVGSLSWGAKESVPEARACFAGTEIAASLAAAQSLRDDEDSQKVTDAADASKAQDISTIAGGKGDDSDDSTSATESWQAPAETSSTQDAQAVPGETRAESEDIARGQVVVKTKSAPEGALEIVITLDKATSITF